MACIESENFQFFFCFQETDKLGCEIYVNEDGAVMSAHHSVVVTFCNPTDKIVVIEAKTRSGQ